jgi:outer membrane protein assembly factor BamD
MLLRLLIVLIFTSSFFSCTKKEEIYSASKDINPYKSYKEGFEAFERNQYFFAHKKFSEAELNFKEVDNAAKSSIMSSFSLYGINFYLQAEEGLERFLKTYPSDKNVIYANYLMAIIYFEQIGDAKKDLGPLLKAEKQINFFLDKYPETDYAIDLKFKKNLILSQLAAKELFIAKYYVSIQKWIPAINRLKLIVEKYSTTSYIEEALHRLVEINYHLNLENEAKKYAKILGYNYNSSEWYEMSYKILNKDYQITKNKDEKVLKKRDNFINKIIKMIK